MTEQDVLTAHRGVFYRALIARDFAALSTLYADAYMLVRPDGSVLNKAQVLRDLMEGDLTFQSIELEGEDVRIHGAVAILTGESRTASIRRGIAGSAHFRLVALYVETDDALQLAYFQSTTLA
jgi:Domain of unknown function (DUF4440)